MARRNVTPPRTLHLGLVQDDLSDVGEGLSRIRAVADLLQFADLENNAHETETIRGAADSIVREIDSLRGALGEVTRKLEVIKVQREGSGGPSLEVVNG